MKTALSACHYGIVDVSKTCKVESLKHWFTSEARGHGSQSSMRNAASHAANTAREGPGTGSR